MTGIRICWINSDGSKTCLRLPPGWQPPPPPTHPGSGGTTSGGDQGSSGPGGSTKPGGGSGKPIVRDDILTDLSLISHIHSTSSSIGDADARGAMTKAVDEAIQKIQEKTQGRLTIEREK